MMMLFIILVAAWVIAGLLSLVIILRIELRYMTEAFCVPLTQGAMLGVLSIALGPLMLPAIVIKRKKGPRP